MMNRLLFLCLLLLCFTACQKTELADDLIPLETRLPPLNLSYMTSPVELSLMDGTDYQFAADIPYDKAHERNVFDIFLPQSETPTPMVIFIHGGGFLSGSKEQAYSFTEEMQALLEADVAFASINYRYLNQTDDGVRTCLNDAKRALQFMRLYADSLNVDAEKIACLGVSAGAGTALWLGTHDDMADAKSTDRVAQQSSRINSAVALATQASYDLVQWETIFAPFDFKIANEEEQIDALYRFYGIASLEELYEEQMIQYRADVDMLTLMDETDAPFYAFNIGPITAPEDEGQLYHHPFHALALQEAAEKAGLSHQVYAPTAGAWAAENETPVEFIIRELKE